jgi:intracellular multiplication protein IcmP
LIVSGLVWYFFRGVLVGIYFKIKLAEIALVDLFTNRLADVKTTILSAHTATIPFHDVVAIGSAVGHILRVPLLIIIVLMAAFIFFASGARVFKQTYGMKDMVLLEKVNWPQITPVANLDLLKTDIDKGPWAMALTPMQFCKRHGLLHEVRRAPQEGMRSKEWNRIDVILKRGQANKVFVVQLGPLWPGINKVPPHVRALFSVFAARINADSKAAANLLSSISQSSGSKLNFGGMEELLKKHLNTPLVQEVLNTRGYLLTVMAEMLQAARLDGVQASADFLWLKPIDRRLWYMLNTVGRQTPFVEVAGPFAHWKAEKEIGRKLIVPMVEEATNALEIALKEIVYKPETTEGK